MKTPTAKQVLDRMKQGDLPTRGGNWYCFFSDGTRVDPRTMGKLVKEGKVNLPAAPSVYSPFTLVEEEEDSPTQVGHQPILLDEDTIADTEQAFNTLGMTIPEGWRIQAMMREANAEAGVVAAAIEWAAAVEAHPSMVEMHKTLKAEEHLQFSVEYLLRIREENQLPPFNADRRGRK